MLQSHMGSRLNPMFNEDAFWDPNRPSLFKLPVHAHLVGIEERHSSNEVQGQGQAINSTL